MSDVAAPAEAAPVVDSGSVLQEHSPQAPAVESAPAEPVVPAEVVPKTDDKFASKFAALSRKEKQLRQQEAQYQTLKKELESLKAKQEEDLKPYLSLKDKLKSDPLSALAELGLSYEDLTKQFVLKEPETPEQKTMSVIESLKQEIESLKAERNKEKEESQKTQEELKRKTEERAKQNYLEHLTKYVNDSAEYELIKANDAVEMIYDVMDQVYTETGKVPTEKEAADHVEAYLLEEVKKLSGLKKVKGLLQPTIAAPEPEKTPSATLSNNLAQQVPSSGDRLPSDDESKRMMANLLKWHD